MDDHTSRETVVAPQYPGSGPKHFRVQVLSLEQAQWLLHACFSQRKAADECLNSLRRRGMSVRLICCNSLPTAA